MSYSWKYVKCAECGEKTLVPKSLSGKQYCNECSARRFWKLKKGPTLSPGTREFPICGPDATTDEWKPQYSTAEDYRRACNPYMGSWREPTAEELWRLIV